MAQIPSSVDIFSRNMTREDEDCGLGWGQVGGGWLQALQADASFALPWT